MSDLSVSREKHPLFAWLLLGLLIAVVVMFGILPALEKSNELSQQIENGYKRLSKMRQIAAAAPQFAAEYERVQRQGLNKLFYPEGMTAAQVGKELQNRLAAVVSRQQGTMLSSAVVDDFNSNAQDTTGVGAGYQRVTVQAVFQGEMQLLRQLLHETAQAKPLMFIETLEIRPANQRRNRRSKEQFVKSTVKVSTYWRGGEQSEAVN